ncbi:MAG: amidohydrolase family protein [Chitinophagaceae bacterium]|jgi:aminodeoxyfutalosine deaminase|nr:amidohydrolase family protein [Chitinophagaceae bacterium]
MDYRKFKATELFDGYQLHQSGKVLITDAAGVVQDLVAIADAGDNVEVFDGILTPGFINAHCHLELSHLKNVIPPHTGLIDFLCDVVTKREAPASPKSPPEEGTLNDSAQLKALAIRNAEKEMFENGIVAVGDIGNTTDTAAVKSNSKIRWQNFVEVLCFTDAKADELFKHYQTVAKELEGSLRTSNNLHRTSLVPHAPYSISPKMFQLINEATTGEIISIHNQENLAENDLYQTGEGGFLRFFNIFGMNTSPFPVTGKTSIRSYLPYFNQQQTILLVHNTYMPEEDIVWANAYADANGLKLIYCLCINANRYIENKTPPVDLLLKHGCTVVLGTDSYSSNRQLSIAKEMEALRGMAYFRSMPYLQAVEQLLQMATINGARALQWNDQLGSFEKGKQPGVVLLSNDFSTSKRLL